jgi:CubicO group peptidase (beta-lactamase class C family)
MPGGSRLLPDRPNLRHLKLEAKRRLAAGEFPSLHEAQVAIAREHGLPNWTALKQRICDAPESHALDQLRWVIARFSGAGEPGWTAPPEDELRLHFDDRFLSAIPPPALIATISNLAADLRGNLVVLGQTPTQAYVQLQGMHYIAVTEAEPPHRLTGLRGLPVGSRVHDPRIAEPPVRTQGQVPPGVAEIAEQAFAELGLTALLLAGGEPGGEPEAGQDAQQTAAQTWVLAHGWADLDRREPLDPGHRFPAPGVTALVTTTAVLRLVADARVGLDDPANDHLRAVRLADDTITVRELLTHTAGIDSPTQLYADQLPELPEFIGPLIPASGPRGTVRPSNGGLAVLGQLVADVTGMPYAEAATRLVLAPLKLTDSDFPARAADISPRAVTGYNLSLDGMFQKIPARIPTLQAVAGLWSTGADLVRLGLGWSALLPEALAHEALTPQTAPGPGGRRIGLGWLITPRGAVASHAGTNLDATAIVTTRIRDQRTHVVLTTRLIPVNSIETRLLSAWTNPGSDP